MNASKVLLRLLDSLINLVVVLTLLIAGIYAGFALWDNSRIYSAVDNVQADMLKLKPNVKEGPSFDELLEINPDVKAWVTMDNTSIDYPIVQGKTNLSYINKDVYGQFALAGSIFLDSRNDGEFEDNYNLLYGHNMEQGKMFGDINLYKQRNFFEENQTGTLITKDQIYQLTVIAVLLVPSSDELIFEPQLWQDKIPELLSLTRESALYLNEEAFTDEYKILALTTCSYEFTDARTAVLTIMEPVSTTE